MKRRSNRFKEQTIKELQEYFEYLVNEYYNSLSLKKLENIEYKFIQLLEIL